ncbi:MAG TPA: amidase, partial [Corynebacterium nuruki]|nr:amidase [Corynebacterium nuruki]
MTTAPSTQLSAAELLADYAAGRRRPSDVITESVARIAETEPTVNAVTEVLDDALAAAREADDLWASGTVPASRPLTGVPVVVKEKHGIAGRPVDQAVPATAEVATADHPIVARLRAAGAVPVARTPSPEFCAATTTDSLAHGVTRNP